MRRTPAVTKLMTWPEAVASATLSGFLTETQEVTENVYACRFPLGPDAAARELARNLPGCLLPSPGKGGISWLNGSSDGHHGPHGSLVEAQMLPLVQEAQGVVTALLRGTERPKWTIGANARKLLLWVGPAQPYCPSAERLLQDIQPGYVKQYRPIPYGYHYCKPGKYEYAEHHDVSAYYYTMMRYAPCFRLKQVTRKKVEFDTWLPDEQARWYDLADAVRANKALRNCLAGVAAGSIRREGGEEVWAYSRNKATGGAKRYSFPPEPGPFRAFGLLLVRCGVEMAIEEVRRCNAVYSNVDCVIVAGDSGPGGYWHSRGFLTELKWRGDAEICHRYCYQVGPHATEFYKAGRRDYTEALEVAPPQTLYHTQWL